MRLRVLALLAALACAAASVARADWTLVEEHFYTLTLAGHPCGRSSERIERDAPPATGQQGRYRTVSRIEMRFSRLGQETRIDLASEFVESARGEPISATVTQQGVEPVRYRFESPRSMVVERGSAAETRELPDVPWLTPREVAGVVGARGTAKADLIRFSTVDVQSGGVVAEITMKRLGEVERQVAGHAAKLARYEVRNSIQPVVAIELYDSDGRLVESSTPIGLGDLVSTLATREEADACYARASFDLLAGTFVASKPIARYLQLRRLELEVESTAGDLADLPSSGGQTFTRTSPRLARIAVDIDRGSGAEPGDQGDARWLKANELIDSDSAEVRDLLARAKLDPGAALFERANALRALVSRHLRAKNLATAFGSASEAARTRSGDCTEHAVLLAALLRAEGIPSRVASGLVYVPDLGGKGPGWGWHLWTQALVQQPTLGGGFGRAWVDFDATVSGDGRGYHPAHLLVATSDLAGGATDPAFSRALSLIGGVKIAVVDREGAAK